MSKATRFTLKHVRISYPSLVTPKPGFNGGDPVYSANFIIDKNDTENLKVLRQFLVAALKEKFVSLDKLPPVLSKKDLNTYVSDDGKQGWPLRDGDFMGKDGYDGMLFISAKNKLAPFVVDEHVRPMNPSKIYAGCYVDAALESFGYANNSNKGVSISLHGVKFVEDGDGFGAAPVAASSFFGEPDATGEDDPNAYDAF